MKPILALDVDGVLIGGWPHQRWDQNLKADLGIEPELLQQKFFGVYWQDILVGKADTVTSLSAFLHAHYPDITSDQLLDYWHNSDANVIDEVLEAAISWRQQFDGVLALATNQDSTRAHHLWTILGFNQHFQYLLASSFLGYQKPEFDFFKSADKEMRRQKSQRVFFLDDSEQNVVAAREYGWHSYHVDKPLSAVGIIQNLAL